MEELKVFKIDLNTLPPETAFYTDIQSDFKKAKLTLEEEICNFKNVVNLLINDLKTKQEKPFNKLEVTQFVNNTNELEKALKDFNIVISKNNERTASFGKEKKPQLKS